MEKKSTNDIDVSELSNGVTKDLVKERDLNKEEAEELGDNLWFNEVDMREPEKIGLGSYLKNQFNTVAGFARRLSYVYREQKTVFADVTKVERTENDTVKVVFEHELIGKDSLVLSPDSVKLVNLLMYRSLENPKDLVGEKVLLDNPSSFYGSDTTVIIPHNVAWNGKIRFATYSFFSELTKKLRCRRLERIFNYILGQNKPLEEQFCCYIMLGFLAALLSLLGYVSSSMTILTLLSIPLILLSIVPVYGVIQVIPWLVMHVLNSDFEEV